MGELLPSELSDLLYAPDAVAREEAWAAFIQAHSRLLVHTARAVGHDYDAAMDSYAYLLGELKKDDFRRLRAYAVNGRSKFTTWLVVVARRLCLDNLRRRYGRPRGADAAIARRRAARRRLTDLVAAETELTALRDPGMDPEAAAIASEEQKRVGAALAQLEPRDRLLLKLRFDDELPVREIARLLGLPTPFHVYRRVKALLKALRETLSPTQPPQANAQRPFHKADDPRAS